MEIESERMTNLWNSKTKISERSTDTFSSNIAGDIECGWGVKTEGWKTSVFSFCFWDIEGGSTKSEGTWI